jgi:hypothetical protein
MRRLKPGQTAQVRMILETMSKTAIQRARKPVDLNKVAQSR